MASNGDLVGPSVRSQPSVAMCSPVQAWRAAAWMRTAPRRCPVGRRSGCRTCGPDRRRASPARPHGSGRWPEPVDERCEVGFLHPPTWNARAAASTNGGVEVIRIGLDCDAESLEARERGCEDDGLALWVRRSPITTEGSTGSPRTGPRVYRDRGVRRAPASSRTPQPAGDDREPSRPSRDRDRASCTMRSGLLE